MKQLLMVSLILFSLTLSAQLTQESRDPVTYETITIPTIGPPIINTKYIDINGSIIWFSNETWEAIEQEIQDKVDQVITKEANKLKNKNKRNVTAFVDRANAKSKLQDEVDRIDGLSGEELP